MACSVDRTFCKVRDVPNNRVSYDSDVLIVGGGPVGLGLAMELALRNISVIIVERNSEIHQIPKGQNLTQRTGEHFKRWGISDAIQNALHIPRIYGNSGVTIYGSLLGKYRFDWFSRSDVSQYYAADNERIPQFETERILQDRFREISNGNLRLGCTGRSVEQKDNGVLLEIQDSRGNSSILYGQYLVGCDGSHSVIRKHAGIEMNMDDYQQRMALIVFQSDELNHLLKNYKRKSFYHIIQPALKGAWQFLGRVNLGGQFFFHAPVEASETASTINVAKYLYDSVGQEFELNVEHVGFWDLRFAVAKNYQNNRVFLAGDSAHTHPPYGGFGINLGFEDARNLGWKLAATLKGWGGNALLASYSSERKPIYDSTAECFIRKMIIKDRDFVTHNNPDTNILKFESAWKELSISSKREVLEYYPHYSGSSLNTGKTNGMSSASRKHGFSAFAGGHLGPVEISSGSNIFDVLGNDFSLICVGIDSNTIDRYKAQAQKTGIPLLIIESEKTAHTDKWDAHFILVRPDNYIACASNTFPENLVPILQRATGYGTIANNSPEIVQYA